MKSRSILALITLLPPLAPAADVDEGYFREKVAPILEAKCIRCHNEAARKGKLALSTRELFLKGGRGGSVIESGNPEASGLILAVEGPDPDMPKDGAPLSEAQVEALREWIRGGAPWPEGLELREGVLADLDWWSLRPLERPPVPELDAEDARWARTPIDAFIARALRERELAPTAPADRRVLVRRLSFDLIGLPPAPEEIEAFLADDSPGAYEKLVERLLASPRYGERWARHWLDVVHYGDTHGYDKDKPRENAWPYRDYVIRAFNEDKSYERFVEEQLAGDVLFPDTLDGVVATGFIAAGPWDFVGHAEVPEDRIDGRIARNLDRDDMVSTTMNTLSSMTVQCARCHPHKFDPVTQEDYYSLQAVFAAVDRADRTYELSPEVARRRRELNERRAALAAEKKALEERITEQGGAELAAIDARIKALQNSGKPDTAAFGYHSNIEPSSDVEKWVQVDLGRELAIDAITIVGCHDDFNSIGAGFGFPSRYRIELSDSPEFSGNVSTVVDHTSEDVPNPGVKPQTFALKGERRGRFVRVTATKLATRQNDYIFALAELHALVDGRNAALGAEVSSLDSIEAPARWQRKNLVDGYYYGVEAAEVDGPGLAELEEERRALIERITDPATRQALASSAAAISGIDETLAALPPLGQVYAGTVYSGSGPFSGTGGRPREIRVLHRGDVRTPGELVGPGTVPIIDGVPARFELPEGHHEGERRAALARWITDPRHPLTWRSIVNRVWQHHFGRGLVETPNDFGRMGQLPTHPELLDWLAVEFRDGGQSIKELHRLIVTSSVYRQSSQVRSDFAAIDGDNRYLWRMNRRRLDAESIRDTVLALSGRWNPAMYGPGFRDFVLEKPEHSPHYEYHKHDPEDPECHRRSVSRFIARSSQEPFMETLDCADPSEMIARRNQTLTALQALALLNNKFVLAMTKHFSERLRSTQGDLPDQIDLAYRLAIGRPLTGGELERLSAYGREHGLANTCRVILNLSEFVFVD